MIQIDGDLVTQALSQGGTLTEGTVTGTLIDSLNIKIDW